MKRPKKDIFVITWYIADKHTMGTKCIPDDEMDKIIAGIAAKFQKEYTGPDQGDEYEESIRSFTDKELAKELWSRFGEIPMDPETEELESAWNGFPKNTFREDIWHWFEEEFNISVATDLMGQ